MGESEPSQKILFRLTLPQLAVVLLPSVLKKESWWRSCGCVCGVDCDCDCGGGEGMVTGGISKDSSGGGGCLHWGRGPARRRV